MGALQIGLVVLVISAAISAAIFGIKKFADPSRIRQKYSDSSDRNNVFVKKYKEADVEYYRGPAMRIGFIAVTVLLIFLFNYSKTESEDRYEYTSIQQEIIEQDVPVTKQTQVEQPPPPPPPPQIQIVADEEVIETVPEFEQQDIDIHTVIDTRRDTTSVVRVEVPVTTEEPETEHEPEIFVVVEQQPEFPGGLEELMKYLRENITYPPVAMDNGIEGTVVVRFVVDEKGGISGITIIKEIAGGCTDEAIRVVEKMPRWKPGYQRGKAVKVYYTLPVRFKLQ